jgi:GT2 family glycosyltransferase
MSAAPEVTVCIPTFRRERELLVAVRSARRELGRSGEIIVGNDGPSFGPELDRTLQELNVRVIEAGHVGQGANNNRLFQHARGEWVILLHDDDWLTEGALEFMLLAARASGADVVYGKQLLADAGGRLRDVAAAEALNHFYYRSETYNGAALPPSAAALVQQFPNDGFMLKAGLAKSVRFLERRDIGTDRLVDFEYGLRLARAARKFCFLDAFTAVYRESADSVKSSSTFPLYIWPIVRSYQVLERESWAKVVALRRIAPKIVPAMVRKLGRATAASFVWGESFPFGRCHPQRLKSLRHCLRLSRQF